MCSACYAPGSICQACARSKMSGMSPVRTPLFGSPFPLLRVSRSFVFMAIGAIYSG